MKHFVSYDVRASHRLSLRQVGQRSRSAFTLVELLVAVAIFLVLASLAYGAFSSATTGDPGAAAASSFRAWVEGAKSRAAELGRPVGIRPIITADAQNAFGHGTNEFEYVTSVEPLEGTLAYVDHFVWINGGAQLHQWRVGQLVTQPPATHRNPLTDQADTVEWSRLNGDVGELNLIQPGLRIEIPRDSGDWYTIADDDPRTADYDEFGPRQFAGGDVDLGNYFTLVGGPTDEPFVSPTQAYMSDEAVTNNLRFTQDGTGLVEHSLPTTSNGWSLATPVPRTMFQLELPRQNASSPPPLRAPQRRLTYRLELGVDVLEGERVLRLPRNMVMDFDASTMPDHPATHDTPFTPFALMFSPTGEVVGDFQSLSALAFVFCERDELILSRQDDNHPANAATQGTAPTKYQNWADNVSYAPVLGAGEAPVPVRAETVGDPQVVTLFPTTGFVQKSLLNFTDSDGDRFANNPYGFRFEGRFDK